MRKSTLLTLALSSLAGCMTSSGGGGPNNPVDDSNVTITSISQFFSVLETQDCDEAFNCATSYMSSGSGDTFTGNFGATVSACVMMESANDMPDMFQTEVTAGRVTFSAAMATTCVQQTVEPMACADYWNGNTTSPDACQSVFVGTVADGASCQQDIDCANLPNGSFCDNGTCDMGSGGSGGSGSGGSGSGSGAPE